MKAEDVLADKVYLSTIDQWPRIPSQSNPKRWLAAFPQEGAEHAVALLDSLIHFPREQTTKLATSAFHSLSAEVAAGLTTYVARKEAWESFLDSAFVTFPTGENPSPTDSGYAFARLIRVELEFPEERIVAPDTAVDLIARGEVPALIFVDDFVGSGNQFLETLMRPYTTSHGTTMSLRTAVDTASSPVQLFYVPALTTAQAQQHIARNAPDVRLLAAHVLPESYSAVHPESVVFPEYLREKARDFISASSRAAGILPQHELGWTDLALALSFDPYPPDATLPLFWQETATWKPLMKRK